jgi:hypothetical protein
MTGTCRHLDADFDFPTGSILSPRMNWQDCDEPADPRSDPNDPRCAKHLDHEEQR